MGWPQALARVGRPGRYTGHEWNAAVSAWSSASVKIALAFPDVYEIGMSNLGLQILYHLVNQREDALADRAFAPWVDLEAEMRAQRLPLCGLETGRPLAEFDLVGFSLQYELNYTNVLNMLDLAGLPPRARDRTDVHPLIIAGGSCALNPEVLADFVDLFALGDGEEALPELLDLYQQARWDRSRSGRQGRRAFLLEAARLPGLYVPELYRATYAEDGRVRAVEPTLPEVPACVSRRIVSHLPPPPVRPIVPYLDVVHDRAAIEIQRGCTRGCRFCQAGMIYRPVRERPLEEVLSSVEKLLANTGYEELSLVSLSTSDYGEIEPLLRELAHRHPDLNVSLPSLRIDSFSVELAQAIQRRKAGFTFAPEAGSQRLRDVINKGVSEDDLLAASEAAFGQGWNSIKLYFMIGLPTETRADVEGIADLAEKVKLLGRHRRGPRARVSVSVATFIPKPHTPFQWVAQETEETLAPKQSLLRHRLKRLDLSWNDAPTSRLEAVLSRGDRRLGQALHRAWELGCRFDAWHEQLRIDKWQQALAETGLDPAFYAHRERSLEETLPWDHLDVGVSKQFLRREYERALGGVVSADCRHGACLGCGPLRVVCRRGQA